MEKFNPREKEFEALHAAAEGNMEPARKLFRPKKVQKDFMSWAPVPPVKTAGTTWAGITGEALEQKERTEEERKETLARLTEKPKSDTTNNEP